MSVQLRLVGAVAGAAPIYKNPSGDYEKFINKYWNENHHLGGKKEIIEKANAEWRTLKSDPQAIQKYLISEGKKHLLKKNTFQPLKLLPKEKDASLSISTNAEQTTMVDIIEAKPVKTTENAAIAVVEREKFLSAWDFNSLQKFVVGVTGNEEFLSDDVINDKSFIGFLISVSYEWSYYMSMLDQYKANEKYQRKKSKLKDKISHVAEQEMVVKKHMLAASEIKVQKSMLTGLISQQFLKKESILKDVLAESAKLSKLLTDNETLRGLRKRLYQQLDLANVSYRRQSSELSKCLCYNNTELMWNDVFETLIDQLNCGTTTSPLDVDVMIALAEKLSSEIVTPLNENDLPECFKIDSAVDQVLKAFPVMLLSKANKHYLINLQELVLTPGALELILLTDDEVSQEKQETDTNSESKARML